jgi:hypothetical protein
MTRHTCEKLDRLRCIRHLGDVVAGHPRRGQNRPHLPQTGPAKAKTWSGVLGTAGGLVIYGNPTAVSMPSTNAPERRSGTFLRMW